MQPFNAPNTKDNLSDVAQRLSSGNDQPNNSNPPSDSGQQVTLNDGTLVTLGNNDSSTRSK